MSKKTPSPGSQPGSRTDHEPGRLDLGQDGQAGILSGQKRRVALRARAAELAKTPPKTQEGQDALEIIEFSLAGENYGVELGFVREVQPLKDFTPSAGSALIRTGHHQPARRNSFGGGS